MLNCQDRETARGRVSYVETEENEADLVRYRDGMDKIAAWDDFGAPCGEAARSELVFAALEAAAPAAEEPAPSATPLGPDEFGPRRRRAVEADP